VCCANIKEVMKGLNKTFYSKRKEYLGTNAKIADMKATMYFDKRANWRTSQQTEVTQHNLH